MKNKELLEIYNEIEYLLVTRKETRFCLGLIHNKKILAPIVGAIRESQQLLLNPETTAQLKQYQNKVDEILKSYAMKDEKGEPKTDGRGGFVIHKNDAEAVNIAVENVKKLHEHVGEYFKKSDEIENQTYDKEISWYFIKTDHLPADLGRSTEILFPLIKD